ncbi:hypothetical protein OG320_05365 [Microbispora sp. NBC_01189]|uniref:hypothetical protein n=1 Tax=Microbispora sp. NBC_01189 TaxID=2903583 RepID=UPI002E0F93E7|nr:hypothetical protein OG320_05365 [Microbispora sp. NBC_01189]
MSRHQAREVGAMPGKGTPRRSIRVDDERWNAAKEKAEKEGRNVSDVLSECLDKYIADDKSKGEGKSK